MKYYKYGYTDAMNVYRPTHRQVNNMLGTVVIAVSLYTLLLPFLPIISFWWNDRNATVRTSIVNQVYAEPTQQPAGNRLLIPSILVDEEIVTGNTLSVIDDGGIWLRPQSVDPDERGNVVLAGHRFTYNQPYGPLYHLDKVSIGDEIGLRWEGATTRYVIDNITTVTADSVGIERQTGEHKLTIYTSSPLLTAENRLVITAREVQ